MGWGCHDKVTVSTVTSAEEAERRHSEVQQRCGNFCANGYGGEHPHVLAKMTGTSECPRDRRYVKLIIRGWLWLDRPDL